MEWIKKGLIYVPDGKLDWSVSHAQVPIPDFIEDKNIIRIYFATRNRSNQSVTGFIEVDADNVSKILKVSKDPVIGLGPIGSFDDCGAMPSWIIGNNDEKYLYYIGWNVRNTVPYHNSVGLAISKDGGETFQKFSEGPLWDRDYKEPYFSASSCVLKENGLWRNWYLSCTGYKMINGKVEPRYHLKYAESADGINWIRNGVVAIDYANNDEAGIVKASVIKSGQMYKMWYSYRNFVDYRTDVNNSYKVGYAESLDGIKWVRKDDIVGISRSVSGWDSDMIAYPHVIEIKGRLVMFYNGNGFGRSGFGYAELKS
jgi:hypothetical protein